MTRVPATRSTARSMAMERPDGGRMEDDMIVSGEALASLMNGAVNAGGRRAPLASRSPDAAARLVASGCGHTLSRLAGGAQCVPRLHR